MNLPPFQRLLDDLGPVVLRYVRAAAGPDADDCYQETWMAALRAYPRLSDASNLRAWVLQIAHRKVVDAARARRRRPAPVAEVPDVAATGPDATGLWDAVRSLPAKQRAAIALRYGAGLPHRDIGAVLKCSDAASRQSVRAGLRRLKEVYDP